MVNCLCLTTVLCNVRECSVLRKYTEIYAEVFRIKHSMSPVYSQVVWKNIWIVYVHTYICVLYIISIIYIYFMRETERSWALSAWQSVPRGKYRAWRAFKTSPMPSFRDRELRLQVLGMHKGTDRRAELWASPSAKLSLGHSRAVKRRIRDLKINCFVGLFSKLE